MQKRERIELPFKIKGKGEENKEGSKRSKNDYGERVETQRH